jgi:hypothetical protein
MHNKEQVGAGLGYWDRQLGEMGRGRGHWALLGGKAAGEFECLHSQWLLLVHTQDKVVAGCSSWQA